MRSTNVLEPDPKPATSLGSETASGQASDAPFEARVSHDRWPWLPTTFAIVMFVGATAAAIYTSRVPDTPPRSSLGYYLLAVIFTSWISGWRWGVVTMFGGFAASALFFTTNGWTPEAFSRHFWYLVVCIPFAAGLGSIRHMRTNAARAAELARERQIALERAAEERQEAQDAARETTDRMLHLLDRIAESMVAFDTDWKITYSNERAGTMLGVAPDWSERETPWELFPGGPALRERLDEARETGLPSRFELSDPATDRWIEYRAYPTPEGLTLFAHDVSEQRRARAALEESEERYRAFISQSTEAIWRFEMEEPISIALSPEEQIDGFYRHAYCAECNDVMARIYGYSSASEMLGTKLIDILPRDDPRNEEHLHEFIAAGYRLDGGESYERDRYGQPKVFLNNMLGIVHEGHFVRAWGTQRDITEQKRQEQEIRRINAELEQRVEERTKELRQANEELGAFCYSVSHDLRAPLRSVMAQSVILQEDYGDKLDEDGKDSLRRLAKAAKNMGQLIDDLLALSRIQRAEVVKEEVDLAKVADAVKQELSSLGCGKVDFDIEETLPASADPRLIQVVLTNLLDNACKFASKGPSPHVSVGKAEDGAFFVRDNGVGFDQKYAEKIFVPFERLHPADEYPGTGIGLANVQRVIERHGGRVWAEAEPGKGATFFFTLP